MVDDPDILPNAVRVFTTRAPTPAGTPVAGTEKEKPEAKAAPKQRRREAPIEVLVFDIETRTMLGHRVMFLVWHLYSDPFDSTPCTTLVEAGIAFADSLPVLDPAGFAVLHEEAHAATSAAPAGFSRLGGGGLRFEPISWWLDARLYRYAYKHRRQCTLVGFNLPFDLGGLCAYECPAERDWRGGWSLGFWGEYREPEGWIDQDFRPRLLLDALDPRRTRLAWSSVSKEQTFQGTGMFVDLRTLVFALTDRSTSLESACELFGVSLAGQDDVFSKRQVEHGVISAALITYALEDVAATAELYRACLAELALHAGVELAAHQLFSPASVGTGYLRAFGVPRPLLQHTPLTNDQISRRWPRKEPPS